jgi:hypothetical protein
MADKISEHEIANVFALEDIFPSPAALLDAHTSISTADANVMIALDTNSLLLPYEIKAGNLKALRDVYEKLAKENRLYLPDRVIREFGRNRDKKLTDLIKALEDRRSKDLPATDMPAILESVPAFNDATKSRDELSAARKKYTDAIGALIDEMKKWRGDDPVIKMYSEILKPTIVEMKLDEEDRKSLLKEWRWRSGCEVPPGYKDAAKPDSGIGDFLVWKCLLQLGEAHKKHLAFVTGEQKADWFARSSGQGIYPRLELLDEYRRASGGKSLRLMSLYELLAEMKVAAPIVEEVKTAEESANTAISLLSSNFGSGTGIIRYIGKTRFDYSTNDGKIAVGGSSFNFILRFSKGSDASIHIYRDGTNLSHLTRIKPDMQGLRVGFEELEGTSRVYTLQIGDQFLARNHDGQLLLGKITGIKDDSRGDKNDEVAFTYVISTGPYIEIIEN